MAADVSLTLAQRRAELARIDTAAGVEHEPSWRSPVCVIMPHRWNNHTACDWSLCTCGCHFQAARLF